MLREYEYDVYCVVYNTLICFWLQHVCYVYFDRREYSETELPTAHNN